MAWQAFPQKYCRVIDPQCWGGALEGQGFSKGRTPRTGNGRVPQDPSSQGEGRGGGPAKWVTPEARVPSSFGPLHRSLFLDPQT